MGLAALLARTFGLGLSPALQTGATMVSAAMSGLFGTTALALQYALTLPPRRALHLVAFLVTILFVVLTLGRLGSWCSTRYLRETSRTTKACTLHGRCERLAKEDPLVRYSPGTNEDCETASIDCAASPMQRTYNAFFDSAWDLVTSTGSAAYDAVGYIAIALLLVLQTWNALAPPRQAAKERIVLVRAKRLKQAYGAAAAAGDADADADATVDETADAL